MIQQMVEIPARRKIAKLNFITLNEYTEQIKTGSTILIKAGYVTDKELPILFTGTISKSISPGKKIPKLYNNHC